MADQEASPALQRKRHGCSASDNFASQASLSGNASMLIALLIIAASVAFTTVLTCSIMLALKSSAAYRTAIERASRSPEVVALVGEPVRAGFFVRGGIRGGGRRASQHARLSGPRGRSRLEIRAVKVGGKLRFDVLKFHGEGKVLDLLSTTAA
jgi:hypothetical protein